jgi:hypothetical protein
MARADAMRGADESTARHTPKIARKVFLTLGFSFGDLSDAPCLFMALFGPDGSN